MIRIDNRVGSPAVVHCKRDRFDVYIGRPSKWGNPWSIDSNHSRGEVIARYREYLNKKNPKLKAAARRELRGKVLGCWCAPMPCHGDILLELANSD